jgi:hypothetical protein
MHAFEYEQFKSAGIKKLDPADFSWNLEKATKWFTLLGGMKRR